MWAAGTEHRLRGVDPQPDPGHKAATPLQIKPVALWGAQVGTGILCPFTALRGRIHPLIQDNHKANSTGVGVLEGSPAGSTGHWPEH